MDYTPDYTPCRTCHSLNILRNAYEFRVRPVTVSSASHREGEDALLLGLDHVGQLAEDVLKEHGLLREALHAVQLLLVKVAHLRRHDAPVQVQVDARVPVLQAQGRALVLLALQQTKPNQTNQARKEQVYDYYYYYYYYPALGASGAARFWNRRRESA
eukprot:1192109-Prorocentrum_minimum.AAC.2